MEEGWLYLKLEADWEAALDSWRQDEGLKEWGGAALAFPSFPAKALKKHLWFEQ